MKETQDNKESFTYVLNEYNALWTYYIKLLDERHRIFNNYIQLIGLPLSIVIAILGGDQSNKLSPIPILAVSGGLFFIGNLLVKQMIGETINAIKYLKTIKQVQNYVKNRFVSDEFIVLTSYLSTNATSIKRNRIEIPDCKVYILFFLNLSVLIITLICFLKSIEQILGTLDCSKRILIISISLIVVVVYAVSTLCQYLESKKQAKK